MSKKDLLLNENKETKTKEVGEIPEVPKIILENDEVTVVFPTKNTPSFVISKSPASETGTYVPGLRTSSLYNLI